MLVYTTEERVQLIQWYFAGNSAIDTVNLFIVAYENRPIPSPQTVINIVNNFRKFGCVVGNCRKCQQIDDEPPVRVISQEREDRELQVCSFVEINGPCSSQQISDEVGVDKRTVQNILHRNKYKCFKVSKAQELFPEDNVRRMEFCETMMERANQSQYFIENILFSDESSFPLHGHHNPSNVRYWSLENKHLFVNERTQYPQKLNVWAGILGDNVIGPFFIEGNLNADRYLNLLRNQIIPAVHELDIDFNQIWFQQDGCPAHNAMRVMEFLHATFPDRIIGGRGSIVWPPRSPDLTPCDFFLWGYIKQMIYKFQHERATNLEQLRQKIVASFETITPEKLQDVRRAFYDRLGYCLAQQGGIFEPLIS